ncbi:type II secretion system F family protein [Aquisediminimonas sediminicola]|uniref:type II secretion system F family protein n=1 Tax=Alteraquisediminimonas sediminicola TaxID=2676787 RepID=UPI001C8D0EA3|nr:type II secretion system F family protein [Aquisediminimonas sediminicola]
MTTDMLRLAILILLFMAVMLSSEALLSWYRGRNYSERAVNRRLKLIEGGMAREAVTSKLRLDTAAPTVLPAPFDGFEHRLAHMLHAAGLNFQPIFILLLMVGGMLAIIGSVSLLTFSGGRQMSLGTFVMVASFALAVSVILPMMVLSRIAAKRRKKVEAQFPVALDVFVRGLRAGHPIASALDLLTTEMSDPIGSEFGLVVDEVTYGAELSDALQSMADRWELQDMQMFVVSLSIQRETGGNLAEILENLASVIRDRASMFMKVRALSSEGRMTAVILTGLPIMAFSALFMLNSSFYLDVADDPAFIPGFGGLLILYLIGYFTIRRMINLEV